MKKQKLIALLIAFFIVFIACLFFAYMIFCETTPLKRKMLAYYGNDEVYEGLYGEIISLEENKNGTEAYLEIDILSENHSFSENTVTGYVEFIIVNFQQENFSVEVGDTIEFQSSPMYFYNGHRLPIISIEAEHKIILDFEDGKKNYLQWIKENF